MTATLRSLAILAAAMTMAESPFAQGSQIPVGNWRSPNSATYTNPAYTSSELYLNIDVAKDGSFSGVWNRYFCTVQAGAYGVSVYSCSRVGSDNRVSGKLGPGRQGTMDLATLGRTTFTWSAPSADELTFELPKNWQGTDAVLYRAGMTRDGRPKPAASAAPAGPLLSAVVLYREFVKDSVGALKRYAGKSLELEGLRGTLIPLSDGGAAIHIPDGFQPRALVLVFADLKQVSGIKEGAQFRFRCTVEHFDYQYLSMNNCAILRE